jgi:RNA polymerase sigma-70 factor, ECF subfamily
MSTSRGPEPEGTAHDGAAGGPAAAGPPADGREAGAGAAAPPDGDAAEANGAVTSPAGDAAEANGTANSPLGDAAEANGTANSPLGDAAEASGPAAGTQVSGTAGADPGCGDPGYGGPEYNGPGHGEPGPSEGADGDDSGPLADSSGRTARNRREPGGWLNRVRGVARPQEAGESESAKPVSDEDLVRALYAEHAAPLLRYALRMTDGDRQRAEDIVQETLLRAWMHPEAIADRPARPWLFAVARNLAVDAHRARKARPHEVGESALSLVAVPDEADRVLESWAVADALAALRPDHRRVLLETYYRGRSVAEAATVLGIPAGTVKSRAFYALRALRLALEERGLAP